MTATTTTTPAQQIDRREDHAEWRANVNARLDAGALKMRSLSEDLKANTDATLKVQTDTSELVSLLRSFQGAFRVFNLIGKAAKPLSYIVAVCGGLYGIYVSWKTGAPPVVHKP